MRGQNVQYTKQITQSGLNKTACKSIANVWLLVGCTWECMLLLTENGQCDKGDGETWVPVPLP